MSSFVKVLKTSKKGARTVPISGRQLATMCHVSNNVFFEAIRNKTVLPQLIIPSKNETGVSKNGYGFDPEYAKEIVPLFPKKRTKGQVVFTAELKDKLKQINKRWEKRTVIADF